MSPSLLSIPLELRLQLLHLVVDDALIVLENPGWDPDVKTWAACPVLWQTHWGILATNHQLRREVLPFYKLQLVLNFPYSPDHSYIRHLSPFLRSKIIRIMLSAQGWNMRLVWHDIFSNLKVVVTGSKIQITTSEGSADEVQLSISRNIDVTWDVSETEGGLDAAKAGRCDDDIIATELENTGMWLKYADFAYPGRKFAIHRQTWVDVVNARDDSNFDSVAKMFLKWDYDTKTVFERHWFDATDTCTEGLVKVHKGTNLLYMSTLYNLYNL